MALDDEIGCPDCGRAVLATDRYCPACGYPLPAGSPAARSATVGDDESEPLLGAGFAERAAVAEVDIAAIWVTDLHVAVRTERALMHAGCLTLAEVAELPASATQRMWSVGAKSVADLVEAANRVLDDGDRWSAVTRERAGGTDDPGAPALPRAARALVRQRDIDLSTISLAQLDLPTRMLAVAGGAGVRTLDDLRRLTNLQVRRRLGVFQIEASTAIADAANRWAAAVAAGESPIVPVGAEIGGAGERGGPTDKTVAAPDLATALRRLRAALAVLPERDRAILAHRFGLDGQPPRTLEEVGRHLDLTRERVRQLEQRALSRPQPLGSALTTARAALDAFRRRLGLGWRDERLATALHRTAPGDEDPSPLVRLVAATLPAGTGGEPGLAACDEAAIAVLARSGPLPLADAAARVAAEIEETDLARFPDLSLEDRLLLVGPGQVGEAGYDLPPEPLDIPNDKRIRRLNALIGVLERGGPAHFREIADGLSRRVPREYLLDEGDVHAWLMRYSDHFVWVGRGRFALRGSNLGHRDDPGADEQEHGESASRRRRGVGDEIATLLRDNGPMPMDDLVATVLERFQVAPASVAMAVRQDRRRRFVLDEDGWVALSDPDAGDRLPDEPDEDPAPIA